ncbi:hypothetical protein B0H11DRAFT_1284901 [Mycena galericulata]|nr:hypothetical protein B0H11DRAFT_1284901 [Mycena galericulata]
MIGPWVTPPSMIRPCSFPSFFHHLFLALHLLKLSTATGPLILLQCLYILGWIPNGYILKTPSTATSFFFLFPFSATLVPFAHPFVTVVPPLASLRSGYLLANSPGFTNKPE